MHGGSQGNIIICDIICEVGGREILISFDAQKSNDWKSTSNNLWTLASCSIVMFYSRTKWSVTSEAIDMAPIQKKK